MINGKKIIGIIPARLESSRLYQKPLHKILGMPLIEHVYRRALYCDFLDELVVATDSKIIVDIIESIGGKAVLTSISHSNPTERMTEVMQSNIYDYYTLINGDEVLLNPESVKVSIHALLDSDADASILAVPFDRENSPSDFKLVLDIEGNVMYISRGDIPSSARNPVQTRLKAYHLMTFRPETLEAYKKLEKTPLEKIEDHEHLRLIENKFKITAKIVHDECISLDEEKDIPIIEALLKKDEYFKEYSKFCR